MTKRNRDRQGQGAGRSVEPDWSAEPTLAEMEAEALERSTSLEKVDPDAFGAMETATELPRLQVGLPLEDSASTIGGDGGRTDESKSVGQTCRCACGGEEFVLEAYLAVVKGRPQPEPLELESITCPQCGREYEAIWLEGGRIARGDFRGQSDPEE